MINKKIVLNARMSLHPKQGDSKNKKFWGMKMSANGNSEADIFIYGDIERFEFDYSTITASTFKEDLDALGDVKTINLYINSLGGSVFEGLAIYNQLKRHKAYIRGYVDAVAASIASVILMAADEIHMPSNSNLMVHNPWLGVVGNAEALRKKADELDRIGQSAIQTYLDKAGDKLEETKLKELLDAESWLSAAEAQSYGLCDVILEANNMVASASKEMLARYKNVPEELKQKSVA